MSETLDMIRRLEAALERRPGQEIVELANAICECCGQRIRQYIGPLKGKLCDDCYLPRASFCGRVKPLVILRSAIHDGE
jgi:hypothetical protein